MSEEPFERMLVDEGERPARPRPPSKTVPLDVWLDQQEAERDALIMRLRQIDKVLVEFGRLKRETLPRRVR